MRRFIVEVVIDTVLLAVILLFLGIVSVPQPFPFGTGSAQIVALRGAGIVGFASWAAMLVLVNRFARPVLVALTGRLLFSTMGLFVVIINAIAIWMTSVIAPIKIGIVADPVLLWIIVAAALYTALSTVADAVLGLNRPDLGADRAAGSGASSNVCRPRVATRSSRTCASSRSTTRSTRRASTSRSRTRRSGRSGAGSPACPRREGRLSSTRAARSASGRCSSSSDRPT